MSTSMQRMTRLSAIGLAFLTLHSFGGTQTASAQDAFLPRSITSSTIPTNGDLNPYGVAFVPQNFPRGGAIAPGDVLVSNFNNISNLQGTGTTIIKLTPTGQLAPGVAAGTAGNATTFFQSHLGGLTTALGVLSRGFVVVGNLPTTDGTVNTISQGALQVIDGRGKLVATLSDSRFLDSPWDLAINDQGSRAQIFVSNVLSGTVSRLDVTMGTAGFVVTKRVQIAVGYSHLPNSAALVLGPTGLAYDESSDTLFVASTADNAIFAVPSAGGRSTAVNKGRVVFVSPHLRGPLALAFAPNGHLLTANGDAVNADPLHPSEIVEFTRTGGYVTEANVDASQGGAFGVATVLSVQNVAFNYAAIDDVANDLIVTLVPTAEQ
ncbi:hypothetical protein DyAD56_13840 [Dyella sp. AD56]|uniref:YncE family protein n=1 Tax=Dyella sp. AD56 TaxID=1528744 RepID=UPI000CB55F04|nr:hypothetical protein [Dyella sp. AD56]PMQ04605.1 hypothetical protein DyAD56_13840 [Dyella sp. AD56]